MVPKCTTHAGGWLPPLTNLESLLHCSVAEAASFPRPQRPPRALGNKLFGRLRRRPSLPEGTGANAEQRLSARQTPIQAKATPELGGSGNLATGEEIRQPGE